MEILICNCTFRYFQLRFKLLRWVFLQTVSSHLTKLVKSDCLNSCAGEMYADYTYVKDLSSITKILIATGPNVLPSSRAMIVTIRYGNTELALESNHQKPPFLGKRPSNDINRFLSHTAKKSGEREISLFKSSCVKVNSIDFTQICFLRLCQNGKCCYQAGMFCNAG